MKFIKVGVPPNRREYLCAHCFRVFKNLEDLEAHWEEKHSPVRAAQASEG